MHQRAAETIDSQDAGMQKMIVRKMKEIERHFNQNINVINNDRQQQKKLKQKLEEIKQKEIMHKENFELSMASKY